MRHLFYNTLGVMPAFVRRIHLCLAGADFNLRTLEAELNEDTHNIVVLKGHTNHINSVEYDPVEGGYIASTGDDQTVSPAVPVYNSAGSTGHNAVVIYS